MTNEQTRARAIEDVKADMENWITEGTAVKGWYTCEKTGKKLRGEKAKAQFALQEKEIEAMITMIEGAEMESDMDAELDEEVQHKAKMALVNANMVKINDDEFYTKAPEGTTKQLAIHIDTEMLNGRTVKLIAINCEDCGAERMIKPQDAFQVKRCEGCQKKHRNAMRAQRRREKRAAEKAGE